MYFAAAGQECKRTAIVTPYEISFSRPGPAMYIVVIAWVYVVGLMAVAEATSPAGTLLGALVTLVLYGVLPLSIVVFILGTPGRRRKLQAKELSERTQCETEQTARKARENSSSNEVAPAGDEPSPPVQDASNEPDASGHAPGAAHASPGNGMPITPVREKL